MSDLSAQIASNLAAIRSRIAQAARRSGRPAQDVRLIAVTKYARLEWVRALVDAGQVLLGESRPQQLIERCDQLPGQIEWHLIGHLQRNKVRTVLPHVALIHSVDSLRLAERISEIAGQLNLAPRVLFEVNVSGEASKDGFVPEALRTQWPMLRALPNLQIAGLMTMAPASDDPQDARPTFRRLRELRQTLRSDERDAAALGELSMGMSGDFEVAIEEGATLVRVGSALFEGLPGES
jgi:PLP dependent protein